MSSITQLRNKRRRRRSITFKLLPPPLTVVGKDWIRRVKTILSSRVSGGSGTLLLLLLLPSQGGNASGKEMNLSMFVYDTEERKDGESETWKNGPIVLFFPCDVISWNRSLRPHYSPLSPSARKWVGPILGPFLICLTFLHFRPFLFPPFYPWHEPAFSVMYHFSMETGGRSKKEGNYTGGHEGGGGPRSIE